MTELATVYNPRQVEADVYEAWTASGAFNAEPADERAAFCMVIPPPNVTAALHLGHALNNTLQDVLIRYRRMCQYATLWMPGCDHAGIATQTVVEKRILAEEGKRRTDFPRAEFVERIQEWKDQYEIRITDQLKKMGCSCDWRRQRFTMDETCAKAVRATFFQLFADGLIYRGKRLVNWDPATQTVLADDEVEHQDVHGHFWYLKYPLVEPVECDGKIIDHVTVATTRPETMLGDTAVAMNPRDPRAGALVGKMVRLPIVGRKIAIIADEHVVPADPESDDDKAKFSTGFLKVTPAHDPDDYQIGQRHDLPMINIMAPDGTISEAHGWEDCNTPEAQNLVGLDRFEARAAIVEWFKNEKLLEDVRDYTHPVGHSYRSHVPIEPYLSDQWYVAVKKQIPARSDEGLIDGTDVPVNSLAGLALTPLLDERLKFTPERYAQTYQTWLENLRDWPISRQLWWGHQIPIWSKSGGEQDGKLATEVEKVQSTVMDSDDGPITYVCVAPGNDDIQQQLEADGYQRDPDVLDTWFSSALWPFSTLGWPDETPEMKKFYPGDVLSTAREIITLWVSRMVMMGQYCVGDIPFREVFIHAMIQDGQGRKMSKSLGNGVDPLEVIDTHGADAMRYTLVSMTTQTQDVRMPLAKMTLPDGREVNSSPKFDIGRNLCNKLWNASRFVLGNLLRTPAWGAIRPCDNIADAWILSRLNATVRDATAAIESYRFNDLAEKFYHFLWDDLCDWYLEIAKIRIAGGERAPKAILAHCLDVTLRLLHPVMPFITEAIWAQLNKAVPRRGPGDTQAEEQLILAQWPLADGETINPPAEATFATLQNIVRHIRNVRKQNNIPPKQKVDVLIEAIEGLHETEIVTANLDILKSLTNLGQCSVSYEEVIPPANAAALVVGAIKVYVLGVVDKAAERARLEKQQAVLVKGVKGVEGKLGNEKFLANAPANVVGQEQKRLEEMQRNLDAVNKSLEAL
ncbi:MAG: valine--tRNA ligase [Phycisphaerae bacterium]|nr:valine--tRNA ligase [Phycisphaerae bacterium]